MLMFLPFGDWSDDGHGEHEFDYNDYSFEECIENGFNDYDGFEPEDIKDMFIQLLNAFGAEITVLPKEKQIPMICNWTCEGFETVGYGCWD